MRGDAIYSWRVIGEDGRALQLEAEVRYERGAARDFRLAIAWFCFATMMVFGAIALLL